MRTRGHCGRFDRFVAGGWAARLSPAELRLWTVLESFADEDGEAWPSARQLAERVGIRSESAIRRSRGKLIAAGLIEVTDTAGGRGKAPRVRMLLPPLPDETQRATDTVCEEETVAPARRVSAINPRAGAQKPARHRLARNKEERAIERAIIPPPAVADDAEMRPADSKPKHRRRTKPDRPGRVAARGVVHQAIIRLWCEGLHPALHDGEEYVFGGGSDAAAIKRLLDDPHVGGDPSRALAVLAIAARDEARSGHDLTGLTSKRVIRRSAERARAADLIAGAMRAPPPPESLDAAGELIAAADAMLPHAQALAQPGPTHDHRRTTYADQRAQREYQPTQRNPLRIA